MEEEDLLWEDKEDLESVVEGGEFPGRVEGKVGEGRWMMMGLTGERRKKMNLGESVRSMMMEKDPRRNKNVK